MLPRKAALSLGLGKRGRNQHSGAICWPVAFIPLRISGVLWEEGILSYLLNVLFPNPSGKSKAKVKGTLARVPLPPPFLGSDRQAVGGARGLWSGLAGDSSPAVVLTDPLVLSRGSTIAHLNWPKTETPRRRGAQLS